MHIADYVRAGMTPDEARRQALLLGLMGGLLVGRFGQDPLTRDERCISLASGDGINAVAALVRNVGQSGSALRYE